MNRRKIISILLVILIMIIGLCGCSNSNDSIMTNTQSSQNNIDINNKVTAITNIIKEDIPDSYYNHEYKSNEQTLYIFLKIDGLSECIATGDVNEYQSLTSTLDELGEVSYRAANYEFNVCYVVLNDTNESNIIYMNLNGFKIYDVSEEL